MIVSIKNRFALGGRLPANRYNPTALYFDGHAKYGGLSWEHLFDSRVVGLVSVFRESIS